jgi:hypothetical protein
MMTIVMKLSLPYALLKDRKLFQGLFDGFETHENDTLPRYDTTQTWYYTGI